MMSAPRMGEEQAPLLAALTCPEAEAADAWKAWRRGVDIEHLTWPEMQILPLLHGPRLEEWLAEDPAGGVLKGIVRRAWSEAQVRLGVARDVVTCLEEARCDSVTLIGAVGAYLRSLQSTAIRPILELRVLVPRRHLARAAEELEADGWEARDEAPRGEWLDRMTHIYFARNGTRLYLHWRILRVDARRAAACEHEFFSDHRMVEAIGKRFRILAPGHALLEAMAEKEETVDALAWQADANLILRDQGHREAIDWARWATRAARYQPEVFPRLAELRAMGHTIPALQEPAGWTARLPLRPYAVACRRAARNWARRISAAMGTE